MFGKNRYTKNWELDMFIPEIFNLSLREDTIRKITEKVKQIGRDCKEIYLPNLK